jgi:hypothetical protein
LGWLEKRRLPAVVERESNRLHGALVAFAGVGLAFVDGSDEYTERRFTLAHEVGHFAGEYLTERLTFARIGGETMLDAHDGRRAVTPVERTRLALAGRPMATRYWACTGRPGESEQLADRIGVELLAPTDMLVSLAPPPRGDYWQKLDEAVAASSKAFGLPGRYVEPQLDALWRAAGHGPSFGDVRVGPRGSSQSASPSGKRGT